MSLPQPGAPITLQSKRLRDLIVLGIIASHTAGLSALLLFVQGMSGDAKVGIWMAYGLWAYWAAMKVYVHWGDTPQQSAPGL